jgi:hypothetical protein
MKYAELSDEAKAKAREWWIDLEQQTWSSDRASDLYEDFDACMMPLGIYIHKDRVMHKRDTHTWETTEYSIQWSGFWSQGDGLVIEGRWKAEEVDLNALEEHARDPVLTAICNEMTALKLKWPMAKAQITTVTSGPGLGYIVLGECWANPDAMPGFDDDDEMPEDDQKALRALIERACQWMYEQLELNYEHDTSDEAAAEAIEANDYDFDEEGALGLSAHA